MGIERSHTWENVAKPDEDLAVFLKLDEVLESLLGDSVTSMLKTYYVNADSGSLNRTSRAQVGGAVDSLSGSPTSLSVWYTTSVVNPEPQRSVNFRVRKFGAKDKIACFLTVSGEEENETNGLFETLRNRMDAEIKRQWPKSKAAKQRVAPSAVSPPAATEPKARGVKQWWGRISMHPLWTTIIGTVVGGLMLAGIVALITR